MSGLAVGAATLSVVPVQTPLTQLTWVVAVGGFAMLPDLDTGGVTSRRGFPRMHGSTIALMWGPLTCVFAGLVARAAGGHRKGTHSLLGLFLWALAATALSSFYAGRLVLVALGIGLALEALAFAIPGRFEEMWPVNLAVSFGAAWWLLGEPGPSGLGENYPLWLPSAVLVGCVTHVVGDLLTVGGVPLAWPLSDARLSVGLFQTGSPWERLLVAPGLLAVTVWMVVTRTYADAGPVLNVIGI
jgi:membrane-bound metal-dependent hydrolase YbcI (DUF457 family)